MIKINNRFSTASPPHLISAVKMEGKRSSRGGCNISVTTYKIVVSNSNIKHELK